MQQLELVTGDRKRAGTIGGFSEYIYCPCPEWEKSIYHIDDAITDKMAALIEPFTVGCRAARRGMPQKGEKAADVDNALNVIIKFEIQIKN